MQAVILAAGQSTRTYPLTITKPKPLLKAANKTILERNLELVRNFAEVFIIVGYKKNMIKSLVSSAYPELDVKFIEQKEQLGTGHAVHLLDSHIKGQFILMLGDNIYSHDDVSSISKHRYSILTKRSKNWRNFGVVKASNGIVSNIIEKPKNFVADMINCGLFSLDRKIFDIFQHVKKSERGEIELTDALDLLAKYENIYCVKSRQCFQISFPWDLLEADNKLRKGRNLFGKGSKINGKVVNSCIGNNCTIGGNIENSIIMDNVAISRNSDIRDSIIAENVNFDGKIISKSNFYSTVKDKKIKIDRLGAVVGDNVTAKKVVIGPGCKIWPNKKITGEIKNDVA